MIGSWKDAFEALPVEQRYRVELQAFEAVARFCERATASTPTASGLAVLLDPASPFLKGYEAYVEEAFAYQMQQEERREWSALDLSRTLVWKATKVVQDDLRRIRGNLPKPNSIRRESDEEHKIWIEAIISYLEGVGTKTARDAAVLFQYVWRNSDTITETPKRGVSFKAQALASELTKLQGDEWDLNRVHRARSFAIKEMSRFQCSSIEDIVRLIQLKKHSIKEPDRAGL